VKLKQLEVDLLDKVPASSPSPHVATASPIGAGPSSWTGLPALPLAYPRHDARDHDPKIDDLLRHWPRTPATSAGAEKAIWDIAQNATDHQHRAPAYPDTPVVHQAGGTRIAVPGLLLVRSQEGRGSPDKGRPEVRSSRGVGGGGFAPAGWLVMRTLHHARSAWTAGACGSCRGDLLAGAHPAGDAVICSSIRPPPRPPEALTRAARAGPGAALSAVRPGSAVSCRGPRRSLVTPPPVTQELLKRHQPDLAPRRDVGARAADRASDRRAVGGQARHGDDYVGRLLASSACRSRTLARDRGHHVLAIWSSDPPIGFRAALGGPVGA